MFVQTLQEPAYPAGETEAGVHDAASWTESLCGSFFVLHISPLRLSGGESICVYFLQPQVQTMYLNLARGKFQRHSAYMGYNGYNLSHRNLNHDPCNR